MSLIKLQPYYVEKIWGGNFLRKVKGLSDGPKLGESLEVSKLKSCSSSSQNGLLEDLLSDEQLPYLVKFIDTSDYLSVQVHPNDEYANRVENCSGKSECWIILDAKEGAGIYLGFKDGVKSDDFFKSVENSEDLTKYLKFFPVSRGDFFFVPAGSVHAIGKDVLLAEVQQSSGITYRVWDWNRVDENGVGRELHVDKARDVLDFNEKHNRNEHFKYQKNILNKNEKIIEHKDFVLSSHTLKQNESFNVRPNTTRVLSVICLKGKLRFINHELELKSYESALLLSQDELSIESSEDCEFLIIR